MPRVLITGAAGFIGMHTAIRFLREGWNVIGLDNFNDYYSVTLKRSRIEEIKRISSELDRDFEIFERDLNSQVWDELADIKFDALVHLAAQAGVRYSIENPRAYLESNIMGFQNVLDFVVNNAITRFVYASSSSVYGKSSKQPFSEDEPCDKPESYYAATKRCNELLAHSYFKTHKVKSIGLRFFTVYGPWGRPDMAPYIFVDAAFSKAKVKVFNHGNQKRDFTYIDDIVEGIFLTISNFIKVDNAEVLNIGYGSPRPLMEFISVIEKTTNRELVKDFMSAQIGDVQETYASIDRLVTLTGYKPRVSLEEGIRELVKWYASF